MLAKRLIKSNPPGKKGANVWVRDTYLRAIGPQLVIPFANAAFWTIWIPATEWFQQVADKMGIEVEWDIYETTFSELLADLWFDNLLDIWNKDPENSTQIELGDLQPVFKSRLVEIIKSFAANNDYKEPSGDGESTTSSTDTTTTTTTQLQYTLDAVKSAAPEVVKPGLWQSGNDIFIASRNSDGEDVDYKISIENNQYMVDIGTRKIKLSDY